MWAHGVGEAWRKSESATVCGAGEVLPGRRGARVADDRRRGAVAGAAGRGRGNRRALTRILTVAAAQLGPVSREEPRADVLARMMGLLEQARQEGAGLVVFPELALTPFFPRWVIDDECDADALLETPGAGAGRPGG